MPLWWGWVIVAAADKVVLAALSLHSLTFWEDELLQSSKKWKCCALFSFTPIPVIILEVSSAAWTEFTKFGDKILLFYGDE